MTLLSLSDDDRTWVDVDDATLAELAARYHAELAPTVRVRAGGDIIPARIAHDGTRYGLRLSRPAPVFTLELLDEVSP